MKRRTSILFLTLLTMLALSGCFGASSQTEALQTVASGSEPLTEPVSETETQAADDDETKPDTETTAAAENQAEDLKTLLEQATGRKLQYDQQIFDSAEKRYTREEIDQMSDEVLAVFRNELYARHGRTFNKEDWKSFFSEFTWYQEQYPADQFDDKQLTAIEKDNLRLVVLIEAERNAPLIFTTDNYPRVDGSTATIPLSEQLAADSMGIPIEEARLYILHNKTHTAYRNLIDGEADIIFVTAPSESELTLASEAGIELEVHPVVKEGFVFLVNEKNPVESLTQQQIRDIYSGKITSWQAVGGEKQEIIAHQRPINSGSQSGMIGLVMKDTPLMDAPTTLYIDEMGGLIDAVLSYGNAGNAMGYSYYYYVSSMYFRKGIRLMAIDGVEPRPETIRDGSYSYTTSYYAVLRKSDPPDSGARKLLDWTLKHGTSSIERAGYVPLK